MLAGDLAETLGYVRDKTTHVIQGLENVKTYHLKGNKLFGEHAEARIALLETRLDQMGSTARRGLEHLEVAWRENKSYADDKVASIERRENVILLRLAYLGAALGPASAWATVCQAMSDRPTVAEWYAVGAVSLALIAGAKISLGNWDR